MRIVALVSLVCLALTAQAASAQDYGRTGLYGTLHGVAAFETFDVPGTDFDTSVGVGGRFGYRFHPNFSLEGQVEWSGTAEQSTPLGDIEVDSTLLAINGRAYLMTGQIQPYGLLGMGWEFSNLDTPIGNADEDDFVGRVGGGVDFYVNENWGLTLDAVYNIPTGDLEDFNYVSLGWGVFFRF